MATTAAFSGKGALTTAMSFKGTIAWPTSFSGQGALTIAFHQKCVVTAALRGSGVLTAFTAKRLPCAAALSGHGTLTASTTELFPPASSSTTAPSGQTVYSPKIRDQSLVRKFISQNGTGYTAISITDGTGYVDPDPGSLNLAVYFDDVTALSPPAPPGVQIVYVGEALITRTDVGHFYYLLGPPNTAARGTLTMIWTYTVNGSPFTFMDFAQILNPMPLYETLSDAEKSIVEQVSWMIGDIFDSTEGGPNLIEPFQTHFDYERIAQMMRISVTRMNFIGFPVENWAVGTDGSALPPTFQGLSVIGTYLEVVRHLIASYTEIPLFQGMNVTYADRRDYAQRWQSIFSAEWPEYLTYVKMAKRSLLNMARGALLVGGGIYGGNALGIFQAGTYASQVRSWRFYPAAPAISWGSMSHGSGSPGGL